MTTKYHRSFISGSATLAMIPTASSALGLPRNTGDAPGACHLAAQDRTTG